MHKRLAHFAASIFLCGVLAPIYAGAATGNPAPAASTTVKAKSFRIIGSKAFPEAELLKLVNDAAGKELSSADIAELAIRITTFYRKHGFQRAHATLPPQNFANGEVRFIVTKSIDPTEAPTTSAMTSPKQLPGTANDSSTHAATIKASGFRIIGSKAYTEAELLPLVDDAIGKKLSADDLNNLAQRITDYYRQHGFQRARAVVYPNTFDGTVAHALEGEVRFLITKLPIGASVTPEQAVAPIYLSAPDTMPEGGDPASVLLRRATWWINRDRDDLAQETLNKLLHIAPNHPDGLAAMAQLEIRMQKMDSAQTTLNTLKQAHPNHPSIARIEALMRSNGRDRDKLRHVRLLEKSGRINEAVAAFIDLYPEGPPTSDLALEYWNLVAQTKQGWTSAHNGLSKLVRENPENLHYRLALAEHETSRLPLNRKALQFIIDMTKVPEYSRQARNSWRRALIRLDDTPANLPLLRAYLAVETGDFGVRAKQTAIVLAEERHRVLMEDPNYRAGVEGTALLDKEDLAAAEPLLEQALKARPNDADLIGEMGLLRMRQGRHAQAHELFVQALNLTHGSSNRWKSLIKTSQFWQLMQESREARDAGNTPLAKNRLYAALKLDPNEPYAISFLAQLQADSGQYKEAEHTYRQALFIEPLNSSALEGLVAIYLRQGRTQAQHVIAQLSPAQRNVLSEMIKRMEIASVEEKVEDPDEFLSALTLIPADKRPENISRSWGNNLDKLANTYVKSGRKDEAVRLLQGAETLAENDEVASLFVAIAWGRIGDYQQADRLFEKLRTAHTPPSTRWHFRHADYLAMKNAPELRAELDAIAAIPTLSPDEAQNLYELQEDFALRTAKAQLDAGKPGLAHLTLAPFLKATPDHTTLLLVEARAYQAEKKWHSAKSAYARVLQLDPQESDAIRGLIESLIALGDRAGALALLDDWTATYTPESAYRRVQIVDLYLALNEREKAKKQLVALLAQYPNDSQALNEAWRMAQNEGHLDNEIVYLKKSIAAERAELVPAAAQSAAKSPSDPATYQQIGFDELGSPKKIQRDWKEKKLANLIDERSAWLSSSIDFNYHPGTPGLSQSHFAEMPLEYKRPWHANDEVFFRTDLVKLDEGNVDSTSTSFGSMVLCQPNCSSAPLAQHAEGLGLTAGYIGQDIRADIGVTPPDFPVSNVVGGVRYSGDFKQFGYSLEVSRRAVTSSLLSYAGTRDPRSGQIWGGVVATGGHLGLSLDNGQTFGFWSSANWRILTGLNVENNEQLQLMAGEQLRIINEENRLLSLGITGMYLHDAKDAGEYTFGHGGYYSPQFSRSLSLPITYGARTPRFSYTVSASVSVSQSQTQSALYFPTDSALQALAPANSVYSSSALSTSHGYSVDATGEYQISQQLFVGGMLSIARAVDYTPDRALFYLRYSMDHAAAQPVFFRPKPVIPSSQF